MTMPWRLVADIGSSPMIEYATRYGVTRTNTILYSIYESSHVTYFNNFKYDLLRLYNMVKEKNIIETEECGDRTIVSVTKPTSYTIDQIDQQYSDIYFLKLYFKIRFWEDESTGSESDRNELEKDCIEIYRSQGILRALYIFERIRLEHRI